MTRDYKLTGIYNSGVLSLTLRDIILTTEFIMMMKSVMLLLVVSVCVSVSGESYYIYIYIYIYIMNVYYIIFLDKYPSLL